MENLTLTQTTSTYLWEAEYLWEADDPWRDWFLYGQKMMEASDQIISMHVQQIQEEEEDKIFRNLLVYPSGVSVMNVQKPIHFGGYL